jgi:LysM repeat protein
VKDNLTAEPVQLQPGQLAQGNRWLPIAAWVIAFGLAALAIYLGWQTLSGRSLSIASYQGDSSSEISNTKSQLDGAAVAVPSMLAGEGTSGILRQSDLHTTIPSRPKTDILQYTVDKGDSVFGIAAQFKLKPESVLWANYSQLNDNPDLISLGMALNIPPVDGVLYLWKEGDTLQAVAAQFQANVDDILNWPGNNIDLIDRKIEPGSLIMVPGGKREYRQWIIPTIARGRAGVSPSVYGAGACQGSYEGAYGSGAFIWPAGNHVLSGNDYWDGHLGIDIAAGEGAPIYAADAGVVVFAGWATGGYGNMVMIDHGNGYQTVYAHMSSVSAYCGQSVRQGTIIGYAGSTGNSTGAHLHFEVRYQGGFVNPWYVLPAP